MKRDAFFSCHPVVGFVYYLFVIGFSMLFMNPACLAVSLTCAVSYSVYLSGKKAVGFQLRCTLPLLLLTAVLNPAFNHEGATILAYFKSGNPLTAESIVYGLAAAAMLAAVLSWFFCYTATMTSDKLLYLFGRLLPSLSLLLSMTLRFVPQFAAQIKTVANAQKCIRRDGSRGIRQKIKAGAVLLSSMATWAFESAVETADSMKSRGYGLPGRTAFSIYRFDARDQRILAFLLFCGLYIAAGALYGGLSWQYFPVMRGSLESAYTLSLLLCYFALCIVPMAVNWKEDRKWQKLLSEI